MSTSELSFLIDLLLKHKLPPATKSIIAERIRDVEICLNSSRVSNVVPAGNHALPAIVARQAPSMQAIMARNPDLLETTRPGSATAVPASTAAPTEPAPVAVVAQTPATIDAMNRRAELIGAATSGKPRPKTRVL